MAIQPQTGAPVPAASGPRYRTFKRNVPVGANQHLAFAAGHGYYTAPGAPHPAAAPVAPAGPADPYSTIIGSLPKPLTNAQITAAANAQISPLVAAVTGTVGKQTAAATHAIEGYTGDAAAKLAAIDWGAPYAGAEQGQAAVDAALRGSLAGAGQSGADELAKRLAVINDPTVGAAAGALQANGADNGTTQVAQGSASLGELLANAAAAGSYGQKLPGIQRLAGLNDIAVAGQQGQAQIAAQAQALEAQLPSIISGLQSRNDQRSQALTAARENQLARKDAIASGASTAADKAATLRERAAATTQTNQTRLDIAKANAEGRASAEQAAQARSDRSYRLQFAKTFGFDPVTGSTLPGYRRNQAGAVVKVGKAAATKAGSGGSALTPHEITGMVQSWHDGKVQNARVPAVGADGKAVYDANGAPVYTTKSGTAGQLTYRQALKRLTAAHVDERTALNYLDSAWKRGEGDPQKGGRGWLMNAEQDTLRRAGLPPRAKIINGHAVLSAQQVAALTKAQKLPPGQHTSDGYFVIAQVY